MSFKLMIAAYLKVNGEIASTQLSVGGEEKCIAKEANNEVNKMLLQSDEILSRILHSRLHSMLFFLVVPGNCTMCIMSAHSILQGQSLKLDSIFAIGLKES